MSALDRLWQLDERWGMRPILTRRQLNRLRRQAAADIPRIDPDLERRGRLWAQNRLRPLGEQRALLFGFGFFGLVAAALTLLAASTSLEAAGNTAVFAWLYLLMSCLQHLNERRIARQLLLELPWERPSDA